MDDLRITIVQPDIKWKAVDDNLIKYSQLLQGIESTDLVVFPEMFQTGFCTDPEDIAENMDGTTVRWMKRTARLMDCAVAGSLVIKDSRHYFNRLIYIDQYENMTWYDKRHLFNMSGEEKKFTRGLNRLVVPLKDWRISFQICYDLRFPVWAKNIHDYDVLINVASWPANRNDVWETILKARAIENQSYVIGVNRVGRDENNIDYIGNSLAVDPKGKLLTALPNPNEGMLKVSLLRAELDDFREKFPVWKDWDDFSINK